MKLEVPDEGYPQYESFRVPVIRRILKALVWFGATAFFASMIWFIYLGRVSPNSPSHATVQVVEMNNHGHRFYVRSWEAIALNVSGVGGWILVALASVTLLAIFGSRAASPIESRVTYLLLFLLVAFSGATIITGGDFPFAWIVGR